MRLQQNMTSKMMRLFSIRSLTRMEEPIQLVAPVKQLGTSCVFHWISRQLLKVITCTSIFEDTIAKWPVC